jgi:hypothetical protein
LINVFALIEVNPLARQSLVNLLEIKETFDNITHFATRHRPIIARASARIREEEAALKNPPA